MTRLLTVFTITVLLMLSTLLWFAQSRIDGLTTTLQAEQSAHAKTRAELTACKSASRAACAVAQAVDGKVDAGQALAGLIRERKK